MKYVFFRKTSFTDGSLWVIIDSKKTNEAQIRSRDGSLEIYCHLCLEACLAYVDSGEWTMRKYTLTK